jgi:hypothetical protein
MIGMDAEIAVWSILRPWGCPAASLLVFSAVGQPKTLPHQFGIQNHCQRHLVLKTLYGCLLMIGIDAEIAV